MSIRLRSNPADSTMRLSMVRTSDPRKLYPFETHSQSEPETISDTPPLRGDECEYREHMGMSPVASSGTGRTKLCC